MSTEYEVWVGKKHYPVKSKRPQAPGRQHKLWSMLTGALACSFALSAQSARAQAQSDRPNTDLVGISKVTEGPRQPSAEELLATIPSEKRAALVEGMRFEAIEKLRPQGGTTNLPSTYATVLHDRGGWRSAAAERGWYLRGTLGFNATIDVLRDNKSNGPQVYTGQRTTLSNSNLLAASYTFDHSGQDITQINFGISNMLSNYNTSGPNDIKLSNIDLFKSFLNRKIEVRAGLGTNAAQFVGMFAGGNTLLANGLGGVIPVQAGLSAPPSPTPYMNITLHGRDGLYSKTGIQRSLSPKGLAAEAEENGFGFNWSQPGSKPLYIQEFGVMRSPGPDTKSAWVRAGGIYNTSRYARFDGGKAKNNWMIFGLADYQVFQSPGLFDSHRGIFVGVTGYATSGDVNLYTSTVEARIYQVGMIPGRPFDLATFNVGYNTFSNPLRKDLAKNDQVMEKGQFSASILYAFNITRGVYFSNSLTYFDHPTFMSGYKPALNYQSYLSVLF